MKRAARTLSVWPVESTMALFGNIFVGRAELVTKDGVNIINLFSQLLL